MTDHSVFPSWLAMRLQSPLPGAASQRPFAPEGSEDRHFHPPVSARVAAVMLLLYPQGNDWHFPLTLRPQNLPDHPGQISFPGGALEADEETRQAALRELEEELGVPPADVTLLGQLSPLYVFASNFLVYPWVGSCARKPSWVPCPVEVQRVLEVPASHLLNVDHQGMHELTLGGRIRRVPHIAWDDCYIWGATSMILGEFAAIVKEYHARGSRES